MGKLDLLSQYPYSNDLNNPQSSDLERPTFEESPERSEILDQVISSIPDNFLFGNQKYLEELITNNLPLNFIKQTLIDQGNSFSNLAYYLLQNNFEVKETEVIVTPRHLIPQKHYEA